jgi:hypothetical protein
MKFLNLKLMTIAAGLVGAMVLAPMASATLVSGEANFAGESVVSEGAVDFCTSGNPCSIAPTGPNTGSFVGLTSASTIDNLTGGPYSGPVNIPDFATFVTAFGIIDFDLTNILPGTGGTAGCTSNTINNTCTPTYSGGTIVSPFTLRQATANTVDISLDLQGLSYFNPPGKSGGTSPTSGGFTTQDIVTGTITGILATINSGGSISDSYSATFVAGVPEPTTAFLGLSGLLMAAGLYRRRNRKV